MSAHSLTTRLKARALELGFDFVGIAPAERSATADAFQQWLDDGRAGEMGYLTRNVERRQDVRRTLPTARSVIVCAMSYYTGDPPPELFADPSRGMISRYAWGDDYHEVMERKLRELLEWLQREGESFAEPVFGKVYVDTGPVLERDLAARAGIGWFGKHTGLLSKQLGNWFFLGELLVSLALDYDIPTTAHCGTCTRCITACPTNAIVAPYQLDARRCISYLTIELKGPIPRELRPLVGNRIYGCDDCLAVCPWNKHARRARTTGFAARDGLLMPELIPMLRLTAEEFRVRFQGSPLKRIKRRGLLRNVCVALGNAGDRRAVPALAAALDDSEPLVRGHAAWALGRLAGAPAQIALRGRQPQEADLWVREEIALALDSLSSYTGSTAGFYTPD